MTETGYVDEPLPHANLAECTEIALLSCRMRPERGLDFQFKSSSVITLSSPKRAVIYAAAEQHEKHWRKDNVRNTAGQNKMCKGTVSVQDVRKLCESVGMNYPLWIDHDSRGLCGQFYSTVTVFHLHISSCIWVECVFLFPCWEHVRLFLSSSAHCQPWQLVPLGCSLYHRSCSLGSM